MINPDTVKTWFDIFRKDDALAEVRILEKNGSKIVKPVILVVLSVFLLKLLYEVIFQGETAS